MNDENLVPVTQTSRFAAHWFLSVGFGVTIVTINKLELSKLIPSGPKLNFWFDFLHRNANGSVRTSVQHRASCWEPDGFFFMSR